MGDALLWLGGGAGLLVALVGAVGWALARPLRAPGARRDWRRK